MSDVFAELQKAFPKVRKRSAVMKIVGDVAERSGVSKFQILSSSRHSEDVEASDEVILKAKKTLKISNAQLGRILGGRKHSIITYSLRRSQKPPTS